MSSEVLDLLVPTFRSPSIGILHSVSYNVQNTQLHNEEQKKHALARRSRIPVDKYITGMYIRCTVSHLSVDKEAEKYLDVLIISIFYKSTIAAPRSAPKK